MEPCQVVTAYLASIRTLVDFDSPLNESYLHAFEELELLNASRSASRVAQRLRAAVCVDTLLHRSYIGMPADPRRVAPTAGCLWSSTSLTEAIAQLQNDIDELTSLRMECDIGARLAGLSLSTSGLLAAIAYPVVILTQKDALEACIVLRRSFLHPYTRLGRVGICTATTAARSGYSLLGMFELATKLLAITEDSKT